MKILAMRPEIAQRVEATGQILQTDSSAWCGSASGWRPNKTAAQDAIGLSTGRVQHRFSNFGNFQQMVNWAPMSRDFLGVSIDHD